MKKFKKLGLILGLLAIVVAIGFLIHNISKKAENTSNGSQASAEDLKISSGEKVDFENIVEITDNYFIEQTNDVFYNMDEYVGKSIKMEGYIYTYEDPESGETCYAVVRNTPGCCGADGLAGLDIRTTEKCPADKTWVEVIGIVGKETVYGDEIPVIKVASMTQKEEETGFVTN